MATEKIALRNAPQTFASMNDAKIEVTNLLNKGYNFISGMVSVPSGLSGLAHIASDAKVTVLSGQTGWKNEGGQSGLAQWLMVSLPVRFNADNGQSYETTLSFQSIEAAEAALGQSISVSSVPVPNKEGRTMLQIVKTEVAAPVGASVE